MRSFRPFLIPLLMLGCSHTKPEEMSAAEHRQEAAEHTKRAQQEEQMAKETQPYVQLPKGSTTGPLGSYSAEEEHHERNAEAERAHAHEHLQAAHTLEENEIAACRDIPEASRSACPLLAPSIASVEEVPEGVILHLKRMSLQPGLLEELQCHLAYEQRTAFHDQGCPLDVRGLSAVAGPGDQAITLKASSPDAAKTARAAMRELYHPEHVDTH